MYVRASAMQKEKVHLHQCQADKGNSEATQHEAALLPANCMLQAFRCRQVQNDAPGGPQAVHNCINQCAALQQKKAVPSENIPL